VSGQLLEKRIGTDDPALPVEDQYGRLGVRQEAGRQLLFLVKHFVKPSALGFLLAPNELRFVGVTDGRAHNMMFGPHLDRGELIEAELNLDMAAATGMETLYGYRDLAETYLAMGREADGLRAVKKDLRINHPWVGRACERLVEMTHDAMKAIWVW
jgi:hypothetical protein